MGEVRGGGESSYATERVVKDKGLGGSSYATERVVTPSVVSLPAAGCGDRLVLVLFVTWRVAGDGPGREMHQLCAYSVPILRWALRTNVCSPMVA